MTRKLFFGVFQFGKLYQVAGYDIWFGEVLLSIVVLVFVSWLSIRGIKKSGLVQSIMAISLATAFLVITISALFSPITHWSNLVPLWGPSADCTNLFSKQAMSGILAIVAVAPWAYVGFETIPQAAEEFSFSIGKVNLIMIVAIAFGCVVYSCNNLVTAAASPEWTEFIKQHDWAVGAAVEALMGKVGLVVLGIAVTSAILTGILGFLTATSRLLYSMARDGYIPAAFATLHPVHGTPANAILFCLAFSAVGPWFGRTALGWFVDMAAIGGAIGFGYATVSCFLTIRRRRSQGLESQPRTALRFLAVLGTILSLGFVALLLIPGMPGCLNKQAYIMLGIWSLIGIVFFTLHGKRS
jgi:amino acid transporter